MEITVLPVVDSSLDNKMRKYHQVTKLTGKLLFIFIGHKNK